MALATPFNLLTELAGIEVVWDCFIDKLEDSADIFNLLRAFPELEARLPQKERYRWQFDQVIPYIFTLVSNRDVLACRQASSRWCHAVDNFLENHPSKRAYQHGKRLTGQVWTPEASPDYYNLGKRFPPNAFKLNTSTKLENCLSRMEGATRNPFVGRGISIIPCSLTVALLEKFGKYIWFIEIVYDPEDGPDTFWESLLECLLLLPNLKHLMILQITSLIPSVEKLMVEGRERARLRTASFRLPPLPHLETLYIWVKNPHLPQNFVDGLVSTYSGQIRRLKLLCSQPPKCHDFPNLTEMRIILPEKELVYIPEQDIYSFIYLGRLDVIRTINAPNLFNLVVCIPRRDLEELVTVLQRFEKLEWLELMLWNDRDHANVPADNGTLPGPSPSASENKLPSLKSLVICIQDREPIYNSLVYFPSLEYLTIVNRLSSRTNSDQISDGAGASLYDSKLWEGLPALRNLRRMGGVGEESRNFCRAEYNAWRERVME